MFLRALLAFLAMPGVVAFAVPVGWLYATGRLYGANTIGAVDGPNLIGPGSEIRRTTLLDSFRDRTPESPEEVVAAMEHHAEVGGVCAHPDPALDPVLQHATLATVAVDVVGTELRVTRGGPCAR